MNVHIAKRIIVSTLLAVPFLVQANLAEAQIYKGKTLTMLINFTAGGPTDVEGRLVAKHLRAFIPGNPSIIVQNMGAAGGKNGITYIAQVAKPDGLTLGFLTWNPLDSMLDSPDMDVSYSDFKFITSASSPIVTYIRKDIPPGIEKPADIAKVKSGLRWGGLRVDVHHDLRARMALEMLGVPFHYTTGIIGLNESMLDLMRNEIQMTGTSLPGYRTAVEPTLVKPGIAIPFYQYAAQNPDGTESRDPGLLEVPTFLEVYQEVKGAGQVPSGVKWDSFNEINKFFGKMNRLIVFPPKTSDEYVQVLREAFAKLEKDATFISDYRTIVKSEPGFLDGNEGQEIIASLATVKPEIKSFLKDYVAQVVKK